MREGKKRESAGAALAAALFILVVILVYSRCGGGAEVAITATGLEPDTIEIRAGQDVTWTNDDRRNHQIMSGAPPVMTDDFVSPVLEKGDSWTHRFDDPGEYPYHDMRGSYLGTVIVKE